MSNANYSVIRYTADPVRNECLNIGILLWDKEGVRVCVDDDAVARAIRYNPRLAKDALLYICPMLRRELQDKAPQEVIECVRSPFLALTGPLFTELEVNEHGEPSLDATLSDLLKEIVTPPKRGGSVGNDPTTHVAELLRSWLVTKKVQRNYVFHKSKSGLERKVTFFANSGSNVALDVLRLAVNTPKDIEIRGDAEARKIFDVLGGEVNRFIVYCAVSNDPRVQAATEYAKTSITALGGEVITDATEATKQLVGSMAPKTLVPL